MSDFFAEVDILVRPNTTTFRAELESELLVATRGIAVPIVVTPTVATTAGATTAAVQQATAQATVAQQAAGAAAQKTAGATAALTREQRAATVAAERLAFAQREVTNASSAQAAASVQATRATTAVLAAERSLNIARVSGNAAAIQAAEKALALAAAYELEASAALTAARAQAAHSASLAQVRTAGIASAGSMLGLRGAVLTAGAAFLGATIGIQAFGRAVGLAVELERELNVFQVTAGATADEMERVSAAARELGRDITLPGVAAQDAAATMTELAKAGLSVEQAMAAARGTLQLATAAQIDNARASELVAGALNAFALDGAEAAKVADLLAGAANASQGSIEDMGIALRQSAGAASQIGLSLEDTVTSLTALARTGLAGSDAGTTLRVALLRLVAPTKAAREELEKFNINLRDAATGNVRVEALFELEAALRKLSKAEADQVRVAVFGQNVFRVSALLGRLTADEFARLEDTVSRAGQAQELAAAQTKGLGGDVEGAKNEFAALGTTVGKVASGPLSLFVRTAGQAAGAINDVVNEVERTDQGLGKTFGDFLNRFSESFGQLNIRFQQGVRGTREFNSVLSETGPIARSTKQVLDDLAAAFQRLADITKNQRFEGAGASPKEILNRVTGFDAQQVRAQIRSSNEALLASLEAEREFLEQQLQRATVKRRPALRRQLEQELLGVINEIRSIQEAAARETQRAADDASRARKEADQNILDALGLEEQRRQNALIEAQAREGLQDDIKALVAIREFYRKALAEVSRTVKDAETKARAIADFTRSLIQINAEIRRARQELIEERQRERAERIAEERERRSLEVQIAQTTGNRAREIRARKAEIEFLKRQVDAAKNGSIEQKRLLAELRQKQRELRELKEEAIKTKDAFREMTFEFLTTQQGFAANLLGNLIPTSATGGLVSPTAQPPVSRVNQAAALAQTQGGFSKAEVATELDLLRAMLSELKAIRGGQGHPEAHIQRRRSGAAMDTQ